jgi:hypothetical protein
LQSVSQLGLCQRCDGPVRAEIESRLRILGESEKLVNESKNYKTRLSRCDELVRQLEGLRALAERGIPALGKLAEYPGMISEVHHSRNRIVLAEVDDLLEKAELKSDSAATATAKATAFRALLPRLHDLRKELTDPAPIEKHIRAIEFKINRIQLDGLIEKAEKSVFKENWTKALDEYKEALFFVKNDSIDDFNQSGVIHELEHKIAEISAKLKPGQ